MIRIKILKRGNDILKIYPGCGEFPCQRRLRNKVAILSNDSAYFVISWEESEITICKKSFLSRQGCHISQIKH
jgi:hypothetical protein